MKKFILSFAAAACAIALAVTGCKSVPEVDTIYSVSKSVGKVAGVVVEFSDMKQEVKTSVMNVLDIISEAVPATNETFVAAWMPFAKAEIAKLVADGRLTSNEGAVVERAVYVVCEGIDLVFVRYPVAKQHKDLVSAAVDGFVTGFKSAVKMSLKADAPYDFDIEAYMHLSTKRDTYQGK